MNICPICQKTSRGIHFKTCGSGINKGKFRYKTYAHSYKELCKNNLKLLRKLYCEKECSVLEIKQFCKSNKFNIPTHYVIKFLLEFNNISYRGLKEANSTNRVRKKFEETCNERYGTNNVLSKGSPHYEKRNNTIKQRYNVENVFQIKEVIGKIQEKTKENKSFLSKKAWDSLTDEERYIRLKKTILKTNSFCIPNNIETKVANAFLSKQISFKFSHFVKNRQFDFLIFNKVLIEVQGDFWHANPVFYQGTDVLSFPGKKKKTAKEIWKKDGDKQKLAEQQGYIMIYLWENEIKKKTSDEIMELIRLRLQEKEPLLQDTQLY